MNWQMHCVIISIGMVFFLNEPSAGGLSAAAVSRIDTTYAKAMASLEAGQLDEAAGRFRAALEINPKHAPSYVGLGHVYFKRGDLKEAEKAFRQALRKRKNYAPALNGLGLVFRKTEKMLDWAIKYFRSAYQADRGYVDAYYNLAQTYREIGDTKELDTYKKLVKVAPDHSDAWFQIGRIYKDGVAGRYRNTKKAEAAYRRQLEVNPQHFGAQLHLGQVLNETGRTGEALAMLKAVVDTPNAHQQRAFLELAEVYQRARDHDVSEVLLDAFLEGLAPDEQAVYYDLSLVAIGDELTRFEATPDEERIALSEAFWAGRDPAPVTAANERWIEHCRRVAYARENFGKFGFPWDARGEVYVRFGEPDHISRSDNILFETEPRVVAVKERLMNQARDAVGSLLQAREGWATAETAKNAIGPMSSTLREIGATGHYRSAQSESGVERSEGASMTTSVDETYARSGALMGKGTIRGWPIYTVLDKVWEYWIYTDVGRGIEVTFTQPYFPGPYKYADPPLSIGEPNPIIAQLWQRTNPRVVVNWAAAKTPSVYRPDFATAPLDFFYDSARFKGMDGAVMLEIYYGIPVKDLSFRTGEDGKATAFLKRGFALFDEDGRRVHRSAEDMELYSEGPLDTTQIAFVPAMDRVSMAPGKYRMDLQILDQTSEKSQVYNQQTLMNSFEGETLMVSDIQLAASIRPQGGGEFGKRDIQVIPNPSRVFLSSQSVFLYYEIYNLKRDEYGATRYNVSHEIRGVEKRLVRVDVLAALGKLLGMRDEGEVINIEYEHVGIQVDDFGYLELDMSNTEPGKQTLVVQVTDENSGQKAASTASFSIQ